MSNQQDLGSTFACVINAPVESVFSTITNRAAISTFVTDAASGSHTADATVRWRFGDIEIDVQAREVVPTCASSATSPPLAAWPTAPNSASPSNRTATPPPSTSEKPAGATTPGIASAFDQCSGWTHFFASLKARLEHNVDLKRSFIDSDDLDST